MALYVYSFDSVTNKPKISTIQNANLLLADGTVGLSATWNAGAHQIQVSVDPSSANDLARKSWVESQITGANVPDATSASGGGVKGKVTFDSDKGLTVTAGVASININTTALQFTTGALDVKQSGIDHANLGNLNSATYTHLTATNHTDLTDGGDSTLHYHAADRSRANHTGTQLSTTISDFTEAVQDEFSAAIAAGLQTGLTVTYTDASNKVDFTANVDGTTLGVNLSNDLEVKDAGITNAKLAGSIQHSKMEALTASRAMVTDGSGFASASSVTATELGYLAGVSSSVQTQLGNKLNLSGGTMSGNIAMGGFKVTGHGTPTLASDVATKAYVDANAVNQDFQKDVIDIQVDNTLDPSATPTNGDRYIITNSASLHANFGTINKYLNGDAAVLGDDDIVEYVSGSSEFRISFDASAHSAGGVLVWVINLAVFYNYSAGSWAEFGGLAGVTAGVGLDKTGNTLSVKLGAGIKELPTGEVGLDLATNSGLELSSELTAGQLQAKVDDVTIEKVAGRLQVKALGIGTTHLAATSVTGAKLGTGVAGNGLTGGNGSAIAALADTTGGVNLAKSIHVTANGIAVKIDDSTIQENGSSQLKVTPANINHDSLGGLNTGDYRHLTSTQLTDLTDAGDSALHYHATDRDRANHTGTQAASTISDFTEAAQDATAAAIAAGTHVAIDLTYTDASNKLDVAAKYDNVTIGVNGSNQLYVKTSGVLTATVTNNSGSNMTAGAVVALSITTAGEIVLADNEDVYFADAIGVLPATINNGNSGLVQLSGEVTVTTDGANFDVGKWVYVAGGVNAGKGTKTAPSGANYQVRLGIATATDKIIIKPQWIG